MQSFVPPKFHLLALLVARLVLPWRLRHVDHVTRVEIDDASLERLYSLSGQRVVLCPNHSYIADSVVLFHLSRLLKENWCFLSALENFIPPVQGLLLRNVGVYSVIRGMPDMRSYRSSRQLLADGRYRTVIFPEGEIVGQNDVIGEYLPGAAQFGFWALKDLRAANPASALPPVYLVPMAIKYLLPRDVRPEIRRRMARLERKLTLADYPDDLYDRLARIGEAVLTSAEREYGIDPLPDAPFNDRVQAAKQAILDRVAREVGVELRPGQLQLHQIRRLFLAIDRIMWVKPAPTSYARQLQQEHRRRVTALYADLWRVLRFAAAFDGYGRETMTWERMVELINRLEWELCGVQRWIGPQTAAVRVGPPIDLAPLFEAYLQRKRGMVEEVTQELENAVRALLLDLNRRARPLALAP